MWPSSKTRISMMAKNLRIFLKNPKLRQEKDRMGCPGPITTSGGDLWMFWEQNDILLPLWKLPSTENRKHE